MISILNIIFGICGTSFKCFPSFLVGRFQRVKMNDTQNVSITVTHKAPYLDLSSSTWTFNHLHLRWVHALKKGFVSLYHLYCDTKSLIKARVEGYADNTAIRSKNSLILHLSFTSCLLASIIYSMMQRNGCWNIFQLINSTKTLVMIVAKPSVQERIHIKGVFRWPLYSLVTEAKNLGVILDSICFNIEKSYQGLLCFIDMKLTHIKRYLYRDQRNVYTLLYKILVETNCFSLLLLLSSLKRITTTLSTTFLLPSW